MHLPMLKIGYFADGPWSHRALDLLVSDPGLEVSFICARFSNPDQYLREKAAKLGIKFFVSANVNSDEFLASVSGYNCDIFVSMSFDQILRERFYSFPRLGTINCHAGKLPFYRGRNILNWALINDEKEFGITVHYIDEGVDTGDIILQRVYPISERDDYGSLLSRAHYECPSVLYEAIQLIRSDKASRMPQESIHSCGSIFSQRKPGDEIIDWNWTSREVFNFVRALSHPGPLAQTKLNENVVSIVKVELVADAPRYKCIPGALLAKDDVGFLVKTGDTYVRVVEWISDVKLFSGGRFCK